MGLNPYLQMQGMVFRIMQHPVSEAERINPHVTDSLINKVYRFRNLNGPGVSLDEPARGLLANYSVLFLQGAFSRQKPLADLKAGIDSLMRTPAAAPAVGKKTVNSPDRQALLQARQKEYQGMLDTAIGSLDRGASLLPDDWRFYMVKAELLMMNDRLDQAEQAVRQGSAIDPGNTQFQQLQYQINAKKNVRIQGAKGS
jgi:tetratricopeptide (TPR) repeat protein